MMRIIEPTEFLRPGPAGEGGDPTRRRAGEARGWWMAIPLVGLLLCCGGPLIAGWIVSTGVVVAFGAWWTGIGHWILGGMVAMLLMGGGALAWLRRQRARSNKDCS